jgi:hypothetical protein
MAFNADLVLAMPQFVGRLPLFFSADAILHSLFVAGLPPKAVQRTKRGALAYLANQ